jgi:hypothetical protein
MRPVAIVLFSMPLLSRPGTPLWLQFIRTEKCEQASALQATVQPAHTQFLAFFGTFSTSKPRRTDCASRAARVYSDVIRA